MGKVLQFQKFQVKIDPGFWSNLGTRKLEELKLDQGPIPLSATYTANNHQVLPSPLSLDENACSDTSSLTSRTGICPVQGQLYCLNTLEGVVNADRVAALVQPGRQLWDNIASGRAEQDPTLLNTIIMLSYCDLKQYKYTYHVGYVPLLATASSNYELMADPTTMQQEFNNDDTKASTVLNACQEYIESAPGVPFFLLSASTKTAAQLCDYHTLITTDTTDIDSSPYLVMIDSNNASDKPGWQLQNALFLALKRWNLSLKTLKVICLRQRRGRLDSTASLIFTIKLPASIDSLEQDYIIQHDVAWESTPAQKLPKTADLGSFMDPIQLAASAVDLNIKLMMWRAVDTDDDTNKLDISSIATTKCLLLGAGTLGCSVARTLLGWGVRHITFIDNSRVAYSNPVRQSLYVFEDCLEGGRPKADAAAKAVTRIFPGCTSRGITMNIPMPGHPPRSEADEAQITADVDQLEQLIQEHDVVYLLLDTRESRWLPTVLCALHNKLAITAALGFDGYVVMRHGSSSSINTTTTRRLGCYFCNDVVAPDNSTRDRTMDQQCTVARPGLSGIAGSLAAELMTTVLQHPLGINAPALGCSDTDHALHNKTTPKKKPVLGEVPHMIRGQLHGYTTTCMRGEAFSQCTACSPTIIDAYTDRRHEFVLDALRDSKYLEELTGLAQLKRDLDEAEALRLTITGDDDGGSDWEEL